MNFIIGWRVLVALDGVVDVMAEHLQEFRIFAVLDLFAAVIDPLGDLNVFDLDTVHVAKAHPCLDMKVAALLHYLVDVVCLADHVAYYKDHP